MRTDKVYIQCNLGYLVGYDGGDDYEWSPDKSKAWRLFKDEAKRRLNKISKTHPEARIVQ